MPRHFESAGARHNYCLCFEQFILKWKAICICKLNARRALPVRVRRARARAARVRDREGEREGWIIVMKRRWTGWLPRAARVKSSGGFCCVNCALVIHCSPPFHVVSRYHRPPETYPAAESSRRRRHRRCYVKRLTVHSWRTELQSMVFRKDKYKRSSHIAG